MKPKTERWVRFAERDFRAAKVLFENSDISELVCYLAQQSVEKYLKAVLAESDRSIPRTHNLGKLYQLTNDLLPELDSLAPDIVRISVFAVATRYPEEDDSDADFSRVVDLALATMEAVRRIVRAHLGLTN